jgi:hypothetical protein
VQSIFTQREQNHEIIQKSEFQKKFFVGCSSESFAALER